MVIKKLDPLTNILQNIGNISPSNATAIGLITLISVPVFNSINSHTQYVRDLSVEVEAVRDLCVGFEQAAHATAIQLDSDSKLRHDEAVLAAQKIYSSLAERVASVEGKVDYIATEIRSRHRSYSGGG